MKVSPTTTTTRQERMEEVVRYNIRRYMRLAGKSQADIATLWGVTRGAVSQRLNGYSVLKFTEVALAAAELGVSISDLMDDKYLLQDEDFTSRLDEADNKKATGTTPMASNYLLRLGLNQRPSDQQSDALPTALRRTQLLFPYDFSRSHVISFTRT